MGCTPAAHNYNTYMYSIKGIFTQPQLDSICISDTLPKLELWNKLPIVDYESKEVLSEYFFIKNDSVYRVEYYKKDSIKITKRIKK